MSRYCIYRNIRIMCIECYKIFFDIRNEISIKIKEKENIEKRKKLISFEYLKEIPRK
jgi:hypothetical protein